jgi:hypothetical protein
MLSPADFTALHPDLLKDPRIGRVRKMAALAVLYTAIWAIGLPGMFSEALRDRELLLLFVSLFFAATNALVVFAVWSDWRKVFGPASREQRLYMSFIMATAPAREAMICVDLKRAPKVGYRGSLRGYAYSYRIRIPGKPTRCLEIMQANYMGSGAVEGTPPFNSDDDTIELTCLVNADAQQPSVNKWGRSEAIAASLRSDDIENPQVAIVETRGIRIWCIAG